MRSINFNLLFELSFMFLGLKSLILGFSLSEAAVLISLIISMVYETFLNREKQTDKEELINKINELQQQNILKIETLEKEIKDRQDQLGERISNIKADQIQKTEKLNDKKIGSTNIDPNKRWF